MTYLQPVTMELFFGRIRLLDVPQHSISMLNLSNHGIIMSGWPVALSFVFCLHTRVIKHNFSALLQGLVNKYISRAQIFDDKILI